MPLGGTQLRLVAMEAAHVDHRLCVLRLVVGVDRLQQFLGKLREQFFKGGFGAAELALVLLVAKDRDAAAHGLGPGAAVVVEFLPPHGLEAAGRNLGHEAEDVRSAEGCEGVAPPRGRGFGKALGGRDAHAQHDEGRVEVSLVQRVEMDIGCQVARGGDETAVALEHVEALEVRAVLHVEPACPVGHVVKAGLAGDRALVDGDAAVGDEAVAEIPDRACAGEVRHAVIGVGTVQRIGPDQHELRDIGAGHGTLGRAAKDRVGAEGACQLAGIAPVLFEPVEAAGVDRVRGRGMGRFAKEFHPRDEFGDVRG